MSEELSAAYATCRAIAKREAKNFYYAFVALPEERGDAICAIYAYMRKADDLADDETLPRVERRKLIDEWLADWHIARQGGPTNNPVFLAVRDACERFAIPFGLLDELVAGTTMDLESADDSGTDRNRAPDTYATFHDLYQYCYLVASVVGLVCIRIFGYTDPRAEKLAERTGIAFQLTNILRDVAEDAERNRIYLPLDYLSQHQVQLEQLLKHKPMTPVTESERALLAALAARAEEFYQSATELLPLIDRDSRPALWVLVRIYHALLKRIERANFEVYKKRISVPTFQKLEILSVGMCKMVLVKLFS